MLLVFIRLAFPLHRTSNSLLLSNALFLYFFRRQSPLFVRSFFVRIGSISARLAIRIFLGGRSPPSWPLRFLSPISIVILLFQVTMLQRFRFGANVVGAFWIFLLFGLSLYLLVRRSTLFTWPLGLLNFLIESALQSPLHSAVAKFYVDGKVLFRKVAFSPWHWLGE